MKQEILRINARTHEIQYEEVPTPWEKTGGRGLTAAILLEEVPGDAEPLGTRNKLIFAPGLLAGNNLSSCDRLSVGGKSPLTGGIKESNAGGTTGLAMALLGIKALILEDRPQSPDAWMIHISRKGVTFFPADEYSGKGVYECARLLMERFGSRVALSIIGPAGEMLQFAAGIANLDKEGTPSRMNGRGGLGAVMGSKKVKAIILDPTGCRASGLADAAAFRRAQKEFTQALMAQPQTNIYRDFGTAGVLQLCNSLGGLPTRNFSHGRFLCADQISGEALREMILARRGEGTPTHACMPGCVIRCSNRFAGVDGKEIVSPLEYETIGLMGSNLGLDDFDDIARLNWQANDLGLDSIEIGAALGVAAEANQMEFGDVQQALELMDEIRKGTPLGRLLGSGSVITGKVLGVERVPAVKGQAISAYDPRAIKGTGVTYATSPQGADHTAGLTIRAKVDHLNPEGQAALSKKIQINNAGLDTLGACLFAGFGFAAAPGSIAALLNAKYGWNVGPDIQSELGAETLKNEIAFNQAAGFTTADDRLPEWMTREPLPPTGAVFDVPTQDLDGLLDG